MTPFKILVIEDLEDIRKLFELFLKKKGFETVGAADGAQGIEAAKNEKPDLALIDIRLPDINGFEVLRQIRDFDKTVKIFMLSGLYTEEQEQEVLRAGATGFINKSEGIGAIVDRVVKILVS
jgi:DNA-binding response OmpR family regulator